MRKKIILVAMAAIACCCTSSKLPDPNRREYADVSTGAHDMIVLGDKLEDPYSVANMTKAFHSLYPTKAAELFISTTDLYVRFLPKNQAEYNILDNLGLEMIDHPVDYEIVKNGDYYHDPSIPTDEMTWQYAMVPPDFSFPSGIKYEILDECYISENSPQSKLSLDIDWTAVEREAFILTGNGDMVCSGTKADDEPEVETRRPEGRIAILDESYDSEPIGVAGVTVSCNVFVKFGKAVTDEQGYYQMNTYFTKDPYYRLTFKNVKGFSLGFNLILVPASFSSLGQHPSSGVNCVIDRNSDRFLFCRAVVNNAGYDYFNQCNGVGERMKCPPSGLRIWLFKSLSVTAPLMMRQGAVIDGSLVERLLGEYTPLLKMFLPDIVLGLRGKEDYASIYGAAIHEFAHASHFMQVGKDYWTKYVTTLVMSFVTSGFLPYGSGTEEGSGFVEIAEMWAYYMQTRVYKDRYPSAPMSFGTNYWFSPQIFFYLDERGLNKYRLCSALTKDITNRELLQKQLLYMYPECKTIINQAFDRYR